MLILSCDVMHTGVGEPRGDREGSAAKEAATAVFAGVAAGFPPGEDVKDLVAAVADDPVVALPHAAIGSARAVSAPATRREACLAMVTGHFLGRR
jgi:hypothetical protein